MTHGLNKLQMDAFAGMQWRQIFSFAGGSIDMKIE